MSLTYVTEPKIFSSILFTNSKLKFSSVIKVWSSILALKILFSYLLFEKVE